MEPGKFPLGSGLPRFHHVQVGLKLRDPVFGITYAAWVVAASVIYPTRRGRTSLGALGLGQGRTDVFRHDPMFLPPWGNPPGTIPGQSCGQRIPNYGTGVNAST